MATTVSRIHLNDPAEWKPVAARSEKTNHKKQLRFSHPNRKVNKLADSDLLSGKGLL